MSPLRFCSLTLLAVLLALPAFAKSSDAQKSLGAFGNWHAFSFTEHDQQVCYMVVAKTPAPNKKLKRGTTSLTITHRPAEGSKDVVSYTPGYNFKVESTVTVRVGTKTYDLFTTKDSAWARDPQTDHALAKAIRGSRGMTLTGAPAQRGAVPVTDTLELNGAAEAYRAIGKACGLEVEPEKPAKTKKPPKLTANKKPVNTTH